MRKISFINSKGLFVNFLIKIILLSLFSVAVLSALFSFIALKIDLDVQYFPYISIIIIGISSAIISFFSVKSFKNNGLVIGILSVLPLIIYSFVNYLIYKNNISYFFIKLVIAIVLGGVFGCFSIRKTKKIRVKK